MASRRFHRCLLRPGDLKPSREDFEVVGVFNPGAVQVGDRVLLLVRVAERPHEQRPGFLGLPRYDAQGLTIDWVSESELRSTDPRVVRCPPDGRLRLRFVSHLRMVRLREGREVEEISEPCFVPQNEYEEFGVEDPRITPLGDTFYFTYVAVSRHGAATALASTRDFQVFTRHGIIFPPENKDVVLFPQRIGGDYWALHRPLPSMAFGTPSIWISRSSDLLQWGYHQHLLSSSFGWEGCRVGGGTPPLYTPEGWLVIYHGNRKVPHKPGVGVYSAGVMLLDLEQPYRILRRSSKPILTPQTEFERHGFVPNVVFPTGIVDCGESVLVYYGAADTATAVVEFSKKDLIPA